jgi:hypothetical protein
MYQPNYPQGIGFKIGYMASIYKRKTAAEKYREAICAHRVQQLKMYNPFRPLRERLRDRLRLYRLRAVKLYREAVFKHTL